MKKKSLTVTLFATLLISGCSFNESVGEKVSEHSIQNVETIDLINLDYSNINDETIQNKISKLLMKNKVEENDVEMFIQSVQNYYKSVEGIDLLNYSEKLSDLQVPYNQYELTDKWMEKNIDFADQNCRLTAFRIFNDFIISESELNYQQMDITNLEFDIDALQYNPDAKFSEDDINKFVNLFSNISVTDINNVEQSAKDISLELKKRKISFKVDDNISIINGYIQDTENNAVFVGHTGIAIDSNEGLIFIEKYGSGLPYQMTVFQDKEELKAYMWDRLKMGFTGETSSNKPIIMENNKLM